MGRNLESDERHLFQPQTHRRVRDNGNDNIEAGDFDCAVVVFTELLEGSVGLPDKTPTSRGEKRKIYQACLRHGE